MTIKLKSRAAAVGLITLGLAIATGFAPMISSRLMAQETTSGITIFGGLAPENRLAYSIDRNRPSSPNARYYLRVANNKLPREVLEMEITYPETFQGQFNADNIELRQGRYRGDSVIPVDDVIWDEANRRIEIYPSEPIPARSNLVVVISNVQNPRRFGVHYFNLKMMYQGDVIRQYAGTWPLEVSAE
ncbi:DUF2808 domain-containing protein [Pseudanabaena sp. FACHB-2040]|uniref:DUF2808 domain-containing protein n=1 Tax=Pseudanabaena sp. FACHB-2040 TaxID=2692859 RepID=UPI001681F8BE|nr:DUF2808 domain-containing protein [Pseudanabaena sp. FACHB-2040]MBD2259792.1 DUF2808 domain-containing protein [Pseudanabaena sp. FACHB-2040]